ncbi:MAG: diaminopimelate decarboxylase [Legionellales bacterium]|nr:diaminopimelate decarboxylase [Legionellales bacterium]
MSEFNYKDSLLHVEEVPLTKIASQFGTPSYVYSRKAIETSWLEFNKALKSQKHLICYAVKANSNIGLLNILAKLGAGFDIVSIGELERVLHAGGSPDKIVFSGVGKRKDEMQIALHKGIKCFNVESVNELIRLNEVAEEIDISAPISLRVNPDVDANTHPYISTGLKDNKFGIAFHNAIPAYELALALPNITIKGIDCHIGSQITTLEPFKDALIKILELIEKLKRFDITFMHIDIGGGLGINYQGEEPPSRSDYIKTIISTMNDKDIEVIIEPGRSIVGNAGVLLTKVEYLNKAEDHNFAIVDAAMNDLIRPALYNSWHDIKRIVQTTHTESEIYDVVGPVCETGDFLGKARQLYLEHEDVLAVCSAGAYGFTMSSNYNSRPRVPEIMVDGHQVHQIRRRETIEELMQGEKLLPK